MKKTINYWNMALCLCLAACATDPSAETTSGLPAGGSSLKKTEWLLGSWRGVFPEGSVGESWERQNEHLFTGSGFFVMGTDTVSKEKLRLLSEGAGVFYEPTVSAQNDGKTVRFKLTSADDSSLVFENPAHDFPQKITYRRIGPDSLFAEISGQQKGEPRTESFPMRRVTHP